MALSTYLGKEVGQGQVYPADATFVRYIVPVTKFDLCLFLILAGYFSVVCCKVTTIVSPLTSDLLNLKRSLIWDEECKQAFKTVKALFCHQC